MPHRFATTLTVSVLALLATACTTTSAGRKYTLAKMDRDTSLVEPHRVLFEEDSGDQFDRLAEEGFSISLNGCFLRYLESVRRPELALFARVKVMGKEDLEENVIWEQVLVSPMRERDEQLVMNKNSHCPWNDKLILPAIDYSGEDVVVLIRIIELDQEDNQRAIQLVNAAASVTAAFRPEAAVGLSVFQTALTFLINNNPDDIEFAYDFALSEAEGPFEHTIGDKTIQVTNLLQPRVGKYVVIKTEHPERMNYPSSYFGLFQHGLRYGLAKLLQVATLGILDWPVWSSPGEEPRDTYLRLLGDPFGLQWGAAQPPEWSTERKLVTTAWGEEELSLSGNDLYVSWEDQPGQTDRLWDFFTQSESETTSGRTLFGDQGYLVLTIEGEPKGRDLDAMRKFTENQKRIEKLNIRTAQRTAAEMETEVTAITAAFGRAATEARIKREFKQQLAAAKTPSEVDAAVAAAEAKFKQGVKPSEEFLPGFQEYLARHAGARKAQLGTARFRLAAPGTAGATALNVAHPAGTTLVARFRAVDGAFAEAAVNAPVASPLGTYSAVTVPALTAGTSYELVVWDPTQPGSPETLGFTVPAAEAPAGDAAPAAPELPDVRELPEAPEEPEAPEAP